MEAIKAIETIYNGYRFRSRLEARWAVFFDFIGVEYQYEPEGFSIDGINYLPDFYLPNNERWIEIKGKKLSKIEIDKCEAFCKAQDKDGVKFTIFIGQPLDNLIGIKHDKGNDTASFTSDPDEALAMGITGFSYQWITCEIWKPGEDKKTHIENDSTVFAVDGLCEENVLTRFAPAFWYDPKITKVALVAGAFKARMARFEHGETPEVRS